MLPRATCVPWVQAGLLAALVLAACVDNPYRASNPQRVKPDGLSVMITGAKSEAEARPLADDYCHTLGRTAHFKGMMQYRARREASKAASFECLPEATPVESS